MLHVRHTVTIGSSSFGPGGKSRVANLLVRASLATPVNTCRVALSPPAGVTVRPGDAIAVKLGYDDAEELVFTGTVETAEAGVDRLTVHGASAGRALTAAFLNLSYDKPKAGDVVSGIIGELGLTSAKVESGVSFASYTVADSVSALDQIRRLAGQCGFDFYAGQDDKLVFAPHAPRKTHRLVYGERILALELGAAAPPITRVEVYGESPASGGQGEAAASWLTKADVKGSAGGTKGLTLRLADPTARTVAAANAIAKGRLAALTGETSGTLRALGSPEVRLGDAVEVAGMPGGAGDGTYKVTAVSHALSVRRGFVTTISLG